MAGSGRDLLIDTSVLIAHFRGQLALHDVLRDDDVIYLSAVTVYELEYGAIRAGRTSDLASIQALFPFGVIPLGSADAQRAAQINGQLARSNRQIGPRDALIAGTAVAHGLTLLSLNVDEFARCPGLDVAELP